MYCVLISAIKLSLFKLKKKEELFVPKIVNGGTQMVKDRFTIARYTTHNHV